eukprot:6806799-Prymnesium_polylepis.1
MRRSPRASTVGASRGSSDISDHHEISRVRDYVPIYRLSRRTRSVRVRARAWSECSAQLSCTTATPAHRSGP